MVSLTPLGFSSLHRFHSAKYFFECFPFKLSFKNSKTHSQSFLPAYIISVHETTLLLAVRF